MIQYHNWSLTEIENMMPWEREIYVGLLIQYIENDWVYSETIGADFTDNYPLYENSNIKAPNIDTLQKKCRAYIQSAFYGQKNLIKKGNKQ